MSNSAIKVDEVYDPVAQELVRRAAVSGQVRLVIDSSKIGFGHQMLMVVLCYRRRTLPLVWTWIPYKKGHSLTSTQIVLLREVKVWLNEGVQVVLGDSEFGHTLLLEELDFWVGSMACGSRGTIWYGSQANWIGGHWTVSPFEAVRWAGIHIRF